MSVDQTFIPFTVTLHKGRDTVRKYMGPLLQTPLPVSSTFWLTQWVTASAFSHIGQDNTGWVSVRARNATWGQVI